LRPPQFKRTDASETTRQAHGKVQTFGQLSEGSIFRGSVSAAQSIKVDFGYPKIVDYLVRVRESLFLAGSVSPFGCKAARILRRLAAERPIAVSLPRNSQAGPVAP